MTKLLLIDGDSASLYEGKDCIHEWKTQGEPFDLRHYQELYPEIVSVGWLKEMDELGRNFPQLQKNLKNVEIIY